MVVIRLSRKGMKKQPMYRLMVADNTFPREGRFLENVGTYHPLAGANSLVLKQDRIQYWLQSGAQPSETVRNLLKSQKPRS